MPISDLDEVRPLLVTRLQAARMLAVSVCRVARLEQEFGLKAIKFAGKTGPAYYRVKDIEDLIKALAGEADADHQHAVNE